MVRWMGLAVAVVGLAGCIGGGNDPEGAGGGGGTGKSTCAQIVGCSMACDDDACTDACIAKGDAAARQEFETVATCASNAQCQDLTYLWANCATEASACGLKPSPDTSLDCVALDACVQECEWDESCMQDGCFSRTDEASATVWMAVYECADDHGCQDQSCVEESCGAELQACANDGNTEQ